MYTFIISELLFCIILVNLRIVILFHSSLSTFLKFFCIWFRGGCVVFWSYLVILDVMWRNQRCLSISSLEVAFLSWIFAFRFISIRLVPCFFCISRFLLPFAFLLDQRSNKLSLHQVAFLYPSFHAVRWTTYSSVGNKREFTNRNCPQYWYDE